MKFKPLIFLDHLLYRMDEDRVMATGSQLTFSLILSIFPFIIVFLNVLSYTSLIREDILSEFIQFLPIETQKIIAGFVGEIAASSSQGLLSIAAILGLWTASSGLQAVIKAINRAYDYKEERSFIQLRVMSLFFTLALILLLILVFLTLVFGELLANKIFSLFDKSLIFTLWEYLRRIIPPLYMVLTFALLYKYSPSSKNTKKIRLKYTLPGAIFASLGWIVTSIAFSFYVNNFGRYAVTYGSLVGIILLLMWLHIASIIIVLGGQINASFEHFRNKGFIWNKEKSLVAGFLK